MKFKYCALALATTAMLSACNSSSDDSNNNIEQPDTAPIASALNITGESIVGSTVTGNYTFTDPNVPQRTQGTSLYNWKVQDNDKDPENDASIGEEVTLLISEQNLDKNIYFCVTPVAEGSNNTVGETKCSEPTQVTGLPEIGSKPQASSVAIDNTSPTVGDKLTASYSYSDPESDLEAVSRFAWKIDGNAIAGADAKQYTLSKQQEGKAITFCVTPVSENPDSIENYPVSGDEQCSATTGIIAPLSGSAPIASASISGNNTVGSVLARSYTYNDADDDIEGSSTFSWKRDGSIIDAESASTYTLQEIDKGAAITFCATPVALTGLPKSGAEVCSTPITGQSNGTKPEAANVIIDNATPTVGDLLTATYGYSDPENDPQGTSQFVWKSNGSVIAGANTQQYTLSNQQEGKQIEFCVTPVSQNPDAIENYILSGDQVCSDQTANTAALTGDAPTVVVSISGSNTVGSELTGAYTYSDTDSDSEGTSTVTWKRDNTNIADETSATYTLQAVDKGTSITFCVTPVAKTGLPKSGTEVCATEVTGIADVVGDIPTVTLNTVTSTQDLAHAKVADVLTAGYNYTASATGALDVSSVTWKADGVALTSTTCTVGTACDLTISELELGKALTYCVIPKATDSDAGVEACSPEITVFGFKITGALEFSKTLTAEVHGYQSPTYSWKVDTLDTEGPTNDNSRSEKATTATYTIGGTVLTTLTDIAADFEAVSGNNNGMIDDADWDQAIRAGSVTTATENAANYIGKDVELCITTVEQGDICLLASQQAKTDVTGGVYYDQADASKRAIEPTREVTFRGTVVYHRPLTKAEVLLGADAGFGTDLPKAHYSQAVMGIEWASLKMDSRTTADITNGVVQTLDTTPGLGICLNLYDAGTNWYLPASRNDSTYTADAFTTFGNVAPMADTGALLIKFATLFDKTTFAAKPGVMGSVNSVASPVFGWPVTGATATPYWSATKLTTDIDAGNSKVNSVKFYDNGASGNNSAGNGRFVSCTRAVN